ncbi:MAG: PilT/PilU family type 4a pilus ATPase [Gemmatales bacterium]|nr:PilT/PilU family type 4a pilus ATPase [Gemmatales bacterium]MDW7993432.1 PilT/PilU family type 4a pilus ATPase [Gemmatales bacterium]
MAQAVAGGAGPQASPAEPRKEPEVNKIFRAVVKLEGSDLHLKVGQPPMVRVKGLIRRLEAPPLTQEDMERLLLPIMKEHHRKVFFETGGVDFAHVIGDEEHRFRVNLFRQRGKWGLVARRVNNVIPPFEKLGLLIPEQEKIRKPGEPATIEKLCMFDQGLIILAGVTGSGKSTTIAAMLEYINAREPVHILTLEDPIEYLFQDKKAIVNQREIYVDVCDWHTALKHAVRQDPDVILVGELRDRESFESAVHAAETGHLVFGTVHASSAASTISRILDLFPPDMHNAIRQALAFNLKAVICQKLLPSIKPGKSRVPLLEIMIVNQVIRELIIKAEDKKIPDAIRIGYPEGMIDFNEHLRQLVEAGEISRETALEVSPNPDALKMALKGIKVMQPGIL